MEKKKPQNAVSEAAAAMGRLGGPARAKKLSAKRRKEIAKEAAVARWGKKKGAITVSLVVLIPAMVYGIWWVWSMAFGA